MTRISSASLLIGLILAAPAIRAGEPDDGIDVYLRDQVARRQIPGLAVAVVRDGKVVLARGYGLASVELGVPATPATVFELASVSKQFTASAVMLLVEEGKLKLDDRVVDRLPGLPTAWGTITIRHLLHHTSGIADYLRGPRFSLRDDLDTPGLIRIAAAVPLDFKAGEAWAYSNTNYLLLGLIVERTTGLSLARFLDERFFRPLGMTSTRVNDPFAVVPGRADGYDRGGGVLRRRDFVSPTLAATGDGGVSSSVLDLARWVVALDSGQVLKPDSLRRMTTPALLRNGKATQYGFGWIVGVDGKHPVVEHTGGISGFNSHLARYPADRLAVVVLANTSTAHAERISRGIASRYLTDLPSIPEIPIDREDPRTTANHRDLLESWLAGKLDPARFTPEARQALFPAAIEAVRKQLSPLGPPASFTWLGIDEELGLLTHRYRVTFGKTPWALTLSADAAGQIAGVLIKPE